MPRGIIGVIENINNVNSIHGFDSRESYIQAGEYAFECCKAVSEYGFGKDELSFHLDFLLENGAKFDYSKALKEALFLASEYEED